MRKIHQVSIQTTKAFGIQRARDVLSKFSLYNPTVRRFLYFSACAAIGTCGYFRHVKDIQPKSFK